MNKSLLPSLLLLFNATACTFEVEPEAHRFTWAWRLVDSRSQSRILSCAEAGVSLVGLALRDSAGTITPYEYGCRPTGAGETAPLADGRYTVAAAALDARKRVLADLTFSKDNTGGDQYLGEIVFPLTPR